MLDILSYCAYTIKAVAKQTVTWGLSSAGRASALQAEGHRFEPYRPHTHGGIAQLARAHGSYPWCRWFESNFRYERYGESYISFFVSQDTKALRKDAQGLPQRSEGTQTQRKLSLESDAFAAQNPAKQDSYSLFSELLLKFCRIFEIYIYFQFTY